MVILLVYPLLNPFLTPAVSPSHLAGSEREAHLRQMARSTAAFVAAGLALASAQNCFFDFGNSSFNLLPYQTQPKCVAPLARPPPPPSRSSPFPHAPCPSRPLAPPRALLRCPPPPPARLALPSYKVRDSQNNNNSLNYEYWFNMCVERAHCLLAPRLPCPAPHTPSLPPSPAARTWTP